MLSFLHEFLQKRKLHKIQEKIQQQIKAELSASNWGRDYGWYIEYQGEVIGELVNATSEDMFWERYTIISNNKAAEDILFNQQIWMEGSLKFRNKHYPIYTSAFAGGDSIKEIETRTVVMRGLYIAEFPINTQDKNFYKFMGWKTSMIIINTDQPFDFSNLFQKLGYEVSSNSDELFEAIIYPPDDKIYLGYCNKTTIICLQELVLDAFQANVSTLEQALCDCFPNTEIATLALHSVVNFWAYSVVKDGKKLRVRAGDADEGIIIDEGKVLEEEKELLAKAYTNTNGEQLFVFEDILDEAFTADQVGENFVFQLCKRYLDEQLDAHEKLWETTFKGFNLKKKNQNKKWW